MRSLSASSAHLYHVMKSIRAVLHYGACAWFDDGGPRPVHVVSEKSGFWSVFDVTSRPGGMEPTSVMCEPLYQVLGCIRAVLHYSACA